MIILNTPQALKVQLTGAVGIELPIVVSFVDVSSTVYTPDAIATATTGATLLTIVSAPTAPLRREIKFISIHNPNAADATVKLFHDSTQIIQITIPLSATLHYTDADGFKVMFINGGTGAGQNAFVYIAYASDASGTDFTNTFDAALNYIAVKNTTTALSPPVAGNFTGLWKNYKDSTPGSNTQVPFNDAGVLAGDAGLVYNKTTDTLTTGSLVATLGQIVFPATQNPSADANTLDDYEEGAWTPSLGGNTTYTWQDGRYTKIGRKVFLEFTIQVNVLGTGATGTISGPPFDSPMIGGGSVGYYAGAATAITTCNCYMGFGPVIQLTGTPAFQVTVQNPIGIFGNGTLVYGSITHNT